MFKRLAIFSAEYTIKNKNPQTKSISNNDSMYILLIILAKLCTPPYFHRNTKNLKVVKEGVAKNMHWHLQSFCFVMNKIVILQSNHRKLI